MTTPIRTDVAIVGGGIVGCSAALALRRFGFSVVVLERQLCGASASGINFGGVRRQGRPLIQLPLAQRAHEIWGNLKQLVGSDCEYQRTGHFKMARKPSDMEALEHYVELTREFDLGLELITGKRLQEQCPWLNTKVLGGSLCPQDGQANPRLVSPAFAQAAKRAGAQIFEQTAVESVVHEGSTFHLKAAGNLQVQSPYLLNCAGAWSARLAQQLGDNVPLEQGYPAMAVTEPLPHFVRWSLGVEGGSIYCRQVQRGNVVFGGGRGMSVGADRVRTARHSLQAAALQLGELIPRLRHATLIRTWSGVEGYLPDNQPIVGPSATTSGLFHGFGFAGAGFQMGPAVGEVLAELVRDGRSRTPIEAFSIQRFTAQQRPS